jgi:hypothetical protein
MKLSIPFTLGFLLFLIFGCENGSAPLAIEEIVVKELNSLSQSGGESNLFVSGKGQVYLSWVEYLSDTTDALKYTTLEGAKWADPKTIASSSQWFVNWADFPSLAVFSDEEETLAAHWLQKSAGGTYDYDVRIALSKNKGDTWAPSFIPHRDSIAAEHGFVSLLPVSEHRIFATWLDGRNTKKENGAMTLRSAEFDQDGNLFEEVELDGKVCDCCQTDVALASNGPIVVYRDRSDEEVRDIYYVRKIDGKWSGPQAVFDDNWTISGCPVNGPAIAAKEDFVAVAWFSSADNNPQVKVAFSNDAGATFGTPVRLDNGNPLGRVDVLIMDNEMALVSWVEKSRENAAIRVRSITSDGVLGDSHKLLETTHSRESGFPVLARSGEQTFLSWTEVDSIGTRVKTGELIIEE